MRKLFSRKIILISCGGKSKIFSNYIVTLKSCGPNYEILSVEEFEKEIEGVEYMDSELILKEISPNIWNLLI